MDKHKIFKVLSSEVRLKIFKFLLNGQMCVTGIMRKLEVTQPTVTQHLKILQEVGLVKSKKSGYWMHYFIDEKGLEKVKKEILDFVSDLKVKSNKCSMSNSSCHKNK